MTRRITFLITVLMLLVATLQVFGQQNQKQKVEYVGTWASDNGDSKTTNNSIFVSISRSIGENRFFVISNSTAVSFLNFIGGGFIREDGFLQVITDKGVVLLFTPAFSARHHEAIAVSIQDIESWNLIRLNEKFDEWPFPMTKQ